MIRIFRSIIVAILAFIAIAIVLPEESYADYGATIEATNCNPAADPAQDSTKTETDLDGSKTVYPYQSCTSQNISLTSTDNPFKVRVKVRPNAGFWGLYVAANLAPVIAVLGYYYWGTKASTTASVTAACVAACGPAAASCAAACTPTGIEAGEIAGQNAVAIQIAVNLSVLIASTVASATAKGDAYINVGTAEGLVEGPIGRVANAEVRIEGDKACVYLETKPVPFLHFQADRTSSFNEKYGIGESTPLPSNCVYTPGIVQPPKPAAPAFISKSCIDYDTNASQFRWAKGGGTNGYSRSFIGVVVQCVEESMTNLFFNKRGSEAKSVFMKTQERLIYLIRALLTLYVVVLGYRFITGGNGLKQNEFIWIGLKVAFVMYFAAGPGMTDLVLPGVINGVKGFSSIVMDASMGATSNKKEAQANLAAAKADFDEKRGYYSAARMAWGKYTPQTVNYSEKTKEELKEKMVSAKEDQDAAGAAFERARVASLSFGYNYCDFRPLKDAGKYNYTRKAEDGVTDIITDMSFMHVWDAIDCRISKYIGVGDDPNSPSTPKILLIGIGSILGSMLGIIIFGLITVFVIFIILVTVRIVHIYIIAYIALLLLAYIAPLVIPMVLFEYTKSSFDAWVKQFIGFAVQPIILFTFLAFMFAICDYVIYADNTEFQPVRGFTASDPPVSVTDFTTNPPTWADNAILRKQSSDGSWVCPDTDALGCLYEKIQLKSKDISVLGATIFRIYENVNANDSGLSTNSAAYSQVGSAVSDSDYKSLMMGLLKAVFVCFILHALLGQVEEMSATLTNVAGGAASMSAAPKADPGKIAMATAVPVAKGLGQFGVGTAKMALKNTFGKATKTARRSGLNSTRKDS